MEEKEIINTNFYNNLTTKEKLLFYIYTKNSKIIVDKNLYFATLPTLSTLSTLSIKKKITQSPQSPQSPQSGKVYKKNIENILITFREYLKQYNNIGYIDINKENNLNHYIITKAGKLYCEKKYNEFKDIEEEKKKKEIELEQNINLINNIKNIKEKIYLFFDNYLENYIYNHSDKDIIIDYQLIKNENIDFEINEFFIENIEEVESIIIEAYNDKYNSNKKNIRIINFKENIKRLKDVRQEDSELLYSECEIDYKSGITYATEHIIYECPSCANIIKIEQHILDEKIQQPFQCVCGRKGKFKIIERLDKQFQKYKVRDLDLNLSNGESPISFNALLYNELAINPILEKCYNISDKVKITYIFKKHYENKETEPKIYFKIYNIEHIDKLDWNKKFSFKEIEEFNLFSKMDNSFSEFSENCFYQHSGDNTAKKIIASQIFNDFSINGSRNYPHILLLGDPGTGKTSNFLNRIPFLVSRYELVDSNANTLAGMLVASKKDDFLGKHIAELGAIPRSNNGYLLIDEVNDLDFEILNCFPQAMETGSINVNKMGVRSNYPSRFKSLMTANPKNPENKLEINKKLTEQKICLSGKLIDRFDFIIPFKKNFNIKKAYDDIFFVNNKQSKKKISDDFLRRYILYSFSFNPKIVKNELFESLKNAIAEVSNVEIQHHRQSEHRCINKVKNLIIAIARFHLCNEVKEEHVKEALEIYQEYIELIQDYDTYGI